REREAPEDPDDRACDEPEEGFVQCDADVEIDVGTRERTPEIAHHQARARDPERRDEPAARRAFPPPGDDGEDRDAPDVRGQPPAPRRHQRAATTSYRRSLHSRSYRSWKRSSNRPPLTERGRRRSTVTAVLMRPGRAENTATRSAIAIASNRSCVTK